MDGNRRAVVRSRRGRSKMSRAVVRCRHDRSWERSLVGSAFAHRGLRGDHSGGGRDGPEPEAEAEGRSSSGGWRRPAILLRDAKAEGPAENSWAQPLEARAACRPIAL